MMRPGACDLGIGDEMFDAFFSYPMQVGHQRNWSLN